VLTEGWIPRTVPDRLNCECDFQETHERWIRTRYTYGETGLADFPHRTKIIVPRGQPNKAVKERSIHDNDLIPARLSLWASWHAGHHLSSIGCSVSMRWYHRLPYVETHSTPAREQSPDSGISGGIGNFGISRIYRYQRDTHQLVPCLPCYPEARLLESHVVDPDICMMTTAADQTIDRWNASSSWKSNRFVKAELRLQRHLVPVIGDGL
jgi:hypothetical protein